MLTRAELRSQIWAADTFVDYDTSLNIAVLKIRQALGDSATHPRFIETVPQRGYRFIAPVELIRSAVPHKYLSADAAPGAPTNHRFAIRRRTVATAAVLVTLASAGAALNTFYPRHRQANESWSIRRLTVFPGAEAGPTWSPDGRLLAFDRVSDGDANIFTMPTSGGDAVQLTSGPGDDLQPRWSPDGRHIAFLSNEGYTERVYMVPALGGVPALIADTDIPAAERFVDAWMSIGSQPWSPDRREFLFSRLETNGRTALWKVNLETRNQNRLTTPPPGSDDLQAAWSGDGKWIVLVRRQAGVHGLWLMPAAGGAPRPILRDANNNGGPAWTTDNQRIVFHSDRSGTMNIFELQISSGQIRRLTAGMGDDADASIGPRGSLLYTHSYSHTDLYELDLENNQEQRLTSNSARNYRPRPSPASRLIAYDSNRTGNFDIWLLDPYTRSERALTDNPAADLAPDWSPDGRNILFISNRDGASLCASSPAN